MTPKTMLDQIEHKLADATCLASTLKYAAAEARFIDGLHTELIELCKLFQVYRESYGPGVRAPKEAA
jgi:hypothetical protein